MEVYLSGQICLLTGNNENAQTTADSGEEDSAYDNLKMEFFYLSPDGNVQKLIPEIRFSLPIHFRHVHREWTVLIVDQASA